MAGSTVDRPDTDRARREARVAGLRDFRTPSLESIERRRMQLLALNAVVLLTVVAGVFALVDVAGARRSRCSATPSRGSVSLLATAGFCWYVFEQERRLGRLTRMLADERVLTAALTNRLHEVTLLHEAGKALNAQLDLDGAVATILDSATELLDANGGSRHARRRRTSSSRWPCAGAQDALGVRIALGAGIAGHVALRREPILIDGQADPNEFPGLADREPYVESAMSVPLVHHDATARRAERERGARAAASPSTTCGRWPCSPSRPRRRSRTPASTRTSAGASPSCSSSAAGRRRRDHARPAARADRRGRPGPAGGPPREPDRRRAWRRSSRATARPRSSAIQRERPDAVILDVMLPGIDGWQVLEQLHALGDPAPVVVCSGKKNPQDVGARRGARRGRVRHEAVRHRPADGRRRRRRREPPAVVRAARPRAGTAAAGRPRRARLGRPGAAAALRILCRMAPAQDRLLRALRRAARGPHPGVVHAPGRPVAPRVPASSAATATSSTRSRDPRRPSRSRSSRCAGCGSTRRSCSATSSSRSRPWACRCGSSRAAAR